MNVKMNSTMGFPSYSYNNNNNSTSNNFTDNNIQDKLNGFVFNPVILIVIVAIIILYYAIFASLGEKNGDNTNTAVLEILIWGVFISLLLLNGMQYFFNINIIASIKNIFAHDPEIDIKVDTSQYDNNSNNNDNVIPEIKLKKQVFHIPGNNYTYNNANAICSAYGAKLASYKDMKNAHEKGADWCSYGWSEGQMAYFPTQEDKWDKLQKVKGHEHDCGRPGINGGYIDNPHVLFGVNCFGYKPKMNNIEKNAMMETPLYPKTQKELNFEKRVDYWRDKIPDILVAPFNTDNWSII